MTPEHDRVYIMEQSQRWARRWLARALRGLLFLVPVLLSLQLVVIGVISTQCVSILGLEVNGMIFSTDSFTCPDPGVPQVYPHGDTPPAAISSTMTPSPDVR